MKSMKHTLGFNSHSPMKFVGLDTRYKVASGTELVRLHLDGAASPLPSQTAIDTMMELLPHYSNTHSYVHNSAQISTKALAWAHEQVLLFLNASPTVYTSVFTGAGTTAAINRVSRGLAIARPDKKIVLVSSMEHHANDLPHRSHNNEVSYIPLVGEGANRGAIDLDAYRSLLEQYSGSVNYVAVSSVSNVTGILNPIDEMTSLAHLHGALILVDGAQSVAHRITNLDRQDVDFFIFSGHKVYTPSSPGVLVAKKEVLTTLNGQDLGGGSVSSVSYFDYELIPSYPDREQSGTPNIIGAVALASVLNQLQHQPMSEVERHSASTISYLIEELKNLPKITIYGDNSLDRTGAISFNHERIDHGLLAAILNDYYAIAVRNECFCAHPYVSELLKKELWEIDLTDIKEEEHEFYVNRKRGMVRVSISLYNTRADVDRLITALREIEYELDNLEKNYEAQPDGSYEHKEFKIDWKAELKFLT